MTTLWQDFLTNQGKGASKWPNYFLAYDRHFSWAKNKSITFWEIGVHEGGSLELFQRYFGPLARIVGIDINAECVRINNALGLRVRIGNQNDEQFLQRVIDEFGIPDIVLDDGSHHQADVMTTFKYVYPKMGKNGVYAVEDLYIAYDPRRGGGKDNPNSFMNKSKEFADQLHARSFNTDFETGVVKNPLLNQTIGVNFYTGMVVYEKGDNYHSNWIQSGQSAFKDHPKSGQLALPLGRP